MHEKKTIGILGGMGPMATVDLFSKIVALTDAHTDSEHIHILIDNYPQIPDRTQSIISGSNAAEKYLIEAAERLEKAGSDFIIIPCNTSHYYINDIRAAVSIPVMDMIEEVAKELVRQNVKCAGVLATDGVLKTELYEKHLSDYGIKALLPNAQAQKKVMSIIYDEVKAGKTPHPEKLFSCLDEMCIEGAQAFILGCTELPLAFKDTEQYKFFDCTDILARSAILTAGYSVKE